jgi:hypothetical protein
MRPTGSPRPLIGWVAAALVVVFAATACLREADSPEPRDLDEAIARGTQLMRAIESTVAGDAAQDARIETSPFGCIPINTGGVAMTLRLPEQEADDQLLDSVVSLLLARDIEPIVTTDAETNDRSVTGFDGEDQVQVRLSADALYVSYITRCYPVDGPAR